MEREEKKRYALVWNRMMEQNTNFATMVKAHACL